MADQRPAILAVTGEHRRYQTVRSAALDRAARDGAALVLYDIDATGTPLESPRPTGWSAEGEQEQFGSRLTADDLDALGQAPVANQVREAEQRGVEAWGWLPDSDDAAALLEYARSQGVTRVFVPDDRAGIADGLDVPVEVVPV